MSDDVSFAALLKHYRLAANLTQADLAQRAQLSAKAVSALERGINRFPRKDTLRLLVEALRLTPQQRAQLEASRARRVDRARAMTPDRPLPGRDRAVDRVDRPRLSPLVGRGREVELIARHVLGHGAPVLAIAGEPGIGKSRLLAEAAERAYAGGMSVLKGSCHRSGGQEPFAALLNALGDSVHRRHVSGARAHLVGCDWLARLLPELAEDGLVDPPRATLRPEQERRLIFRAVSRYLDNIATATKVLLLLDDMQWADPDTVDLLEYLAATASDTGLRILLAYRDTEVDPQAPLSDGLALLAHRRAITHVQLGPLSEDAALELLQSASGAFLDRDQARRALGRAGGVPFFLLSWSLEQSAAAREPGTLRRPTWDVTQSIRQRVRVLPAGARRAIEVAAVLGRSASLEVLRSACARIGIRQGECDTALDALAHARLLLPAESGTYTFAHDLIREVVEGDLGQAKRASLYREAAAAVERGRGLAPPELLGYLYSAGDDLEKAASYLEAAGDRAMMMRAHMRAAQAYRELSRQFDILGKARGAAQVRERLGDALILASRHDEALDALDQALAVYQAECDREGIVRVAARIGEAHALRGTPDQGLAALRPILDEAAGSDVSSRSCAALLISASWLINCTGDYVAASSMALRAASMAAEADDARLSVQANLRYGHLLLMLERLDEGARVLDEVIPLAETIDDLRSIRFALNTLGWSHELRGNFRLDAAYTERAVEVAERLGDPSVIAFMTCNHGGPFFNSGQWAQARAHYEEGLALARQIGPSWASAWPPCLLGQLELAAGRLEEGESLLRDAIRLAERTPDLQALRWAHGALAEWELLRGEPQAALDRLTPLMDRPGQREVDACLLLPLRAWAHFDLLQEREGDLVLSDGIDRATNAGMIPTLLHLLRVRTMRESRRANWAQAQTDLRRAIELCRTVRSPYGEAKTLHSYGVACLQQGQSRQAERYLSRAQTILARLGEGLYRSYTSDALASLSDINGTGRSQMRRH